MKAIFSSLVILKKLLNFYSIQPYLVNTTIQGSAADLVKVGLESFIFLYIDYMSILYRYRFEIYDFSHNQAVTVHLNQKIEQQFPNRKPRLVHHIHDEIIYECPNELVQTFEKVMENSMTKCPFLEKFGVNFAVKIRNAKSWDKL